MIQVIINVNQKQVNQLLIHNTGEKHDVFNHYLWRLFGPDGLQIDEGWIDHVPRHDGASILVGEVLYLIEGDKYGIQKSNKSG